MILAGKVGENEVRITEDAFGNQFALAGFPISLVPEMVSGPATRMHIPKADAVQSGIRVGRTMFCKTHPDYIPFSITNTILGGYFGSRLMANIREDKGYTYGIGSALSPYSSGGSFFISTEVGKEVCGAALSEIYFELERLTKEIKPDFESVNRKPSGAVRRRKAPRTSL